MSPFCGGILIGVIVGGSLGVVLAGLLASAKCGECGDKIERWLAQKTG